MCGRVSSIAAAAWWNSARSAESRSLACSGDSETGSDSEVTREREQREGVPLTVGVRIRSTLAELENLRDQPGVEARFSDAHIAMSVFVVDHAALVTPHLSNQVGHGSPLLHLRLRQDDGLFDRFAAHVEDLWTNARPVWETEDIHDPQEHR